MLTNSTTNWSAWQ